MDYQSYSWKSIFQTSITG